MIRHCDKRSSKGQESGSHQAQRAFTLQVDNQKMLLGRQMVQDVIMFQAWRPCNSCLLWNFGCKETAKRKVKPSIPQKTRLEWKVINQEYGRTKQNKPPRISNILAIKVAWCLSSSFANFSTSFTQPGSEGTPPFFTHPKLSLDSSGSHFSTLGRSMMTSCADMTESFPITELIVFQFRSCGCFSSSCKNMCFILPRIRSCIPEISNPNAQCHLSSPGHHALRSHPQLVADSVSAPCTGNCCSVQVRSDVHLCQIHLLEEVQKSTYPNPNQLLKASRHPNPLVLILCRLPYWLLCQLDRQLLCRLLYQLHCHLLSGLLCCRRHPKWRRQKRWSVQIPASWGVSLAPLEGHGWKHQPTVKGLERASCEVPNIRD